MDSQEILDIVNERGETIGSAPRSEIHGNNRLLHKVVHLFVFDENGDLLLQKRSMNKDVAPGKWDTSVGGHVDQGETTEQALKREMEEELGIKSALTDFMYNYIHKNDYESELVFSYRCTHTGEITFNNEEIDEVKYWNREEIVNLLGEGVFSDNFEDEFKKFLKFQS